MSAPSYRRDQVVSIINSVIHKINRPQDASRDLIGTELQQLKAILDDLRQQLSASTAQDVSLTHIPSATDELDAVSGATEAATVTIMEACENIMNALSPAPDANAIVGEVTRIYEACTFQDITGQRISKVIRTLKTIDGKVAGLLHILDGFGANTAAPAPANEEKSLLNGPQFAHQAMTQDEIDKLLEGL